MSKDWYEDVYKLNSLLVETNRQLDESEEAIERLAEFASEQAYNAEAYKDGMTANFKTANHFLTELEERDSQLEDVDGDVAMWRQLCHSRAVQLNEAYDEIARLRSQIDYLNDCLSAKEHMEDPWK